MYMAASCMHQGGFLTPTLGNTNVPRAHFLLLLLELDIVSHTLMERVFDLCAHFEGQSDNRPIGGGSYEEFLKSVDLSSKQNTNSGKKRDVGQVL